MSDIFGVDDVQKHTLIVDQDYASHTVKVKSLDDSQPTQSDAQRNTPIWTEAATIQTNGSWDGNTARSDALREENERLREHLISALDTLKDAEVCDDNCGPCNEARAALQEQSK